MKKILPKTKLNPHGFTLIELLVVMTIIAILAVTGFVVYSGISARARDVKRIAEIDGIQKAMEKNYQPGTGYVVLSASDFANSVIPADPLTGTNKCGALATQICDYCVVTTKANYAACTNKVSATQPPAGSSYTVCANLETAAGASGATYYCKSNAQ